MWGTLRHAANAALIMLQVNTHLFYQFVQSLRPSYVVTQENGLNYLQHRHGDSIMKTQDEKPQRAYMYIDIFKIYYLNENARNMPRAVIPLTTVSPLQINNSFTI
jgi:hypothetical protein